MSEENGELLPQSTRVETTLDVASFVSSAVPWIGGPVSNVLGGLSFGRKLNRVREVLEGLTSDLKEFKSDVSEDYVRTEDFEEILEQTLKRVAEERNEEKRNIYRSFLTNAIENPGETYDEQLRFLRTLEELQPDHLRVIDALSQTPESIPDMMGSPNQTLRKRLPDISENRIAELVDQLNNMRLTNITTLKVMMTGQGAADLRGSITPYGQRFLQYLMEAEKRENATSKNQLGGDLLCSNCGNSNITLKSKQQAGALQIWECLNCGHYWEVFPYDCY